MAKIRYFDTAKRMACPNIKVHSQRGEGMHFFVWLWLCKWDRPQSLAVNSSAFDSSSGLNPLLVTHLAWLNGIMRFSSMR